jgi:hypothetical protein
MRYYDELARYERDGFEVIVDKTWEDMDPADSFDDTCYDIKEIREDIESGRLDWFMLRVRALVDGHELGSAYLGGCLYGDARNVLTDGTAEDIIEEALVEARRAVWPLMRRLQAINADLECRDVA